MGGVPAGCRMDRCVHAHPVCTCCNNCRKTQHTRARTRLPAAWGYVDAAVAYVFGLDQSKYQWAVDTHNYQASEVRAAFLLLQRDNRVRQRYKSCACRCRQAHHHE